MKKDKIRITCPVCGIPIVVTELITKNLKQARIETWTKAIELLCKFEREKWAAAFKSTGTCPTILNMVKAFEFERDREGRE